MFVCVLNWLANKKSKICFLPVKQNNEMQPPLGLKYFLGLDDFDVGFDGAAWTRLKFSFKNRRLKPVLGLLHIKVSGMSNTNP